MTKPLVFSNYAWKKLLYLRDAVDTEIGGWGLTAENDDMYVEDILLCDQEVTSATVEFSDKGLSDLQNEMLASNIYPYRYNKVWIHTHPGDSAKPSGTDEDTIKRMIECLDSSTTDHVIMFIIAKGGNLTCRLCIKDPKYGIINQEITVLYEQEEENPAWKKEIETFVRKRVYQTSTYYGGAGNNHYNKNYSQNQIGFSSGSINTFRPDLDEPSKKKEKEIDTTAVIKKEIVDSDLFSADLAEVVYAKYMVNSVSELNADQLNELSKEYGKGVSIYLNGLEEEFKRDQKLDYTVISYIKRQNNVKSLNDLSPSQWRDVITNHFVTKSFALEKESYYERAGWLNECE